jgi:hypothetical protein
MSNEIKQDGTGNLALQDIHDSNFQIFIGKTYEFNELDSQLKTQQKLFARTPEDEQQERLEISAKINELENRIKQFKEDVLRLAEQFNRIEINTDRLERAKEHFDKGEIGESRAVLEMELEQMTDENNQLIKQRDHFEQDVLPKLKANAEEFLILALSTQSNYDNPNWFADTCSYFERSIEAFPTKFNLFNYAHLLQQNNFPSRASIYYYRLIMEFQDELSVIDSSTLNLNLAAMLIDTGEFLKAIERAEFGREELRIFLACDSEIYLEKQSKLLSTLSTANKKLGNLDLAEEQFIEANNLFEGLEDKYPTKYQSEIAQISNNAGELFHLMNKNEKSQCYLEKALDIRRKLANENPLTNTTILIETLNNLFALEVKQNNFEKAAILFDETIEKCRNLVEQAPLIYRSDLALVLSNSTMIMVWRHTLNPDSNYLDIALNHLEEAKSIYLDLMKINYSKYAPNFAMTLGNISAFYLLAAKDIVQAQKCAIDTLIFILHHTKNTKDFEPYKQTAKTVLYDCGLTDEQIQQSITESEEFSGEI